MHYFRIFSILVMWASVTHAEMESIVVGHAANFSDVSNSAINPYNKAVTNGLETAIGQFAKVLVSRGLQIKIQNFDYGNKEISAIETVQKIIASPAVAAIGFYESGQALLAAPELEKARLPLISPVASATRLFTIGEYFHPISFSNQDMGFALAHTASQLLHAKSALVVAASDCAYCADLAVAFEEKARALKIVTHRINVLSDDSSFEKINSEIAGKKYDVVVVPNHELTSAKIVAHLMKLGIKVPFLGGDGWGNADGSGFFQIVNDPNFVGYCVGHWHPALSNKLGREFVENWKKKFGQLPTTDSAMAYESMRLLITAILKTKTITRATIQTALSATKTYEGITGTFHFSKGGKSPKTAIVLLKSDMKKKSFQAMQNLSIKE